jgi:phosphoribosyl 1,2-cyclic phosphate phosphodiesterase
LYSNGAPGAARETVIEALLLGTGTSVGVPFIGCDCAVCTSGDPRNQRLRSSVLLRDEGTSLLVDCGPDFRAQALRYHIAHLDAVLLTHEHADHVLGLDDLRLLILHSKEPIPIYGAPPTLDRVREIYAYAFDGLDTGSFKPRFHLEALADLEAPVTLAGVDILPIPVEHGATTVVGLRVGDFAYIPDCKRIPEASLAKLRDLDTLVIDGLRRKAHRTHFNVEEALAAIAEIGPRQAWLTHLTHDLDATTDDETLPGNVRLAYDGLILPVGR